MEGRRGGKKLLLRFWRGGKCWGKQRRGGGNDPPGHEAKKKGSKKTGARVLGDPLLFTPPVAREDGGVR